MNELYRRYLFDRHLLTPGSGYAPQPAETAAAAALALSSLFGIRLLAGEELCDEEQIRYVSRMLGKDVPEPFYRGFPASVRALSREERAFDQLFHYITTYGMRFFDRTGHSLFEQVAERPAFAEGTPTREFTVISNAEAEARIREIVCGFLASTRPLNDVDYSLVSSWVKEHAGAPAPIASKNTCMRLMLDTGEVSLADALALSDVPKLALLLQEARYGLRNTRKLNWRNRDRVFMTHVIDRILDNGRIDLAACYEKKKDFAGLLHHLHYRAKTEEGHAFLRAMRGDEHHSVMSSIEAAMETRSALEAADLLLKEKGSGALARNLAYILSRCQSEEDHARVTLLLEKSSVLLLLQLLLHFSSPQGAGRRTFRFQRFGMLTVHEETEEEAAARRSVIPREVSKLLAERIRMILAGKLHGRLGTVYIGEEIRRTALPLQEGTSQKGYGVLPRGSRIPLPPERKVRVFTYWEKVNDIDLSAVGIWEDGTQSEFSWRTMYGRQSEYITYSGDETSGYNGGSEYFDVSPRQFADAFPMTRYIIFSANVYTGIPFSKCTCRAGYMMRDTADSGQVFEPKTVESSFAVDCESTFAHLFALDLETNELVWLSTARDSSETVAGKTSFAGLLPLLDSALILNLGDFARLMAARVTFDPSEADVLFTDASLPLREGQEQIRSFDTERILALMEG